MDDEDDDDDDISDFHNVHQMNMLPSASVDGWSSPSVRHNGPHRITEGHS